MDTLDIFSNLVNQSLDFDIEEEKVEESPCPKQPNPVYLEGSLDLTIEEEKTEETPYPKQSNPVYFGKSFEYAGRWAPGQSYYNNNYRVTFITYKNCLLACNLTHTSSEETEPVILYKEGVAVGVENIYWQLVLSGNIENNLDSFQTYIEELREKINKNTADIKTNNSAVEIVSKQYNLISQHLDSIDKKHKEIETAFSKQTPWIGSKEEYESLENKDPDKFYFIYEE